MTEEPDTLLPRGRLLLIGADRATLRAATELGYQAIVMLSEETRDFGLVEVPDHFRQVIVSDTSRIEALMTAWFRIPQEEREVLAVVTSEEFALVPAALMAQYLKVRGPDLGAALVSRDKAEQKRRLTAAGLFDRSFTVIDDLRSAPTPPVMDLGTDGWIVKPIAGCATEATVRIRARADWATVRAELLAESERRVTYVVESFVPGSEWSVDGAVLDGTIVFAVLARYDVPLLSVVEGRLPCRTWRPGPEIGDFHARAVAFAQDCLDVLGSIDGAFHLEFFRHGDELVFGECAMRRGAGSTQEEIWAKWGVDLAQTALQCALGVVPVVDPVPVLGTVASIDLPCAPGLLLVRPDEAELKGLPGVVESWLEVPIGMTMPELTNTVYRLGSAVVTCPPEGDLDRVMDDVVTWVRARTRVVGADTRPVELRG